MKGPRTAWGLCVEPDQPAPPTRSTPTGDNVETGTSISLAAGHLSGQAKRLYVVGLTDPEECRRHLEALWEEVTAGQADGGYGLVLDGMSATVLLEHHAAFFVSLANRMTAVLCCRLSPIQKAHIVRLVKKGPPENSKAHYPGGGKRGRVL